MPEFSVDSVSTMTISVCTTSSSVRSHISNPSTTVNDNLTSDSTPTHITKGESSITTLPASTRSSKCIISNVLEQAEDSLYIDDFRLKHDGDFRLILQNPRGIKEFRDEDPECLPAMMALKEGQCGLLCFVETNVA